MSKEREKFYQDSKMFFETGVLTEIYSNDDFCICNISNQCYGVFPYVEVSDIQTGVLMVPEHIKQIVYDNNMFNYIINNMDRNILEKRTIVLNKQMLESMINMKNKNDLQGPTTDIDFEMEQELMSKNKSR